VLERRECLSDVNTLVGRGSHFEGKMTFEGVVRVDGSFAGEIVSDDTLIIGEGAEVRAELDVATVVIYGVVYGNIRASNCVELHAPGHLVGNIVSPALVIERGASFDGNCRMGLAGWTQSDEGEVVEVIDQDQALLDDLMTDG
jgi:cytoskeletal protein CcmA (bactofilin family)